MNHLRKQATLNDRFDEVERLRPIRYSGSETTYKTQMYHTNYSKKIKQTSGRSSRSNQDHTRRTTFSYFSNNEARSDELIRQWQLPFYENETGSKRTNDPKRFGLYRRRDRHGIRDDGKEMEEPWRTQLYRDGERRRRLPERTTDSYYNESGKCERTERLEERKFKQHRNARKKNERRVEYRSDKNSSNKRATEGRLLVHTDEPKSKKQKMQSENSWIVEPRNNSREENDDIAAKVFTVLIDNGGKLKRKELEARLRAVPLTMEFLPSGSFVKFLNVYDGIFEIQISSSEDHEEDEILDPTVNAKSNIQICINHSSSTKSCTEACNDLHVCKFYFISECSFENCKFGHDLRTEHNKQALAHHYMQYLSDQQIKCFLTDLNHRKGVTVPSICSFYNYIQGCSKPKTECPHLHVCAFIAGKCAFYPKCKRSHDLDDEQPKQVLKKHGIEVTSDNKDSVMALLSRGLTSKTQGREKCQSEIDGSSRANGAEEKRGDKKRVPTLQPVSQVGKNFLRYWTAARLNSVDLPKSED